MKRVLSFCLALIMCVGLVSCGENKSALDKMNSFTELDEENKMFMYNNDDMYIAFSYNLENLQILFLGSDDISYIYYPSEDMFELKGEYDTVDAVSLYYYVGENKVALDQDDFEYNLTDELSGCYSYENCLDEISDYFIDEGYLDNATKYLEKLNKLLKKNDLTMEDIDVPYDELDK